MSQTLQRCRCLDLGFTVAVVEALAFGGQDMFGRQTLQTASLVKSLARKTQLGQIFTFTQVAGLAVDGVFRTSVRGWFTLAHSLFTFGSLEGHI